MIKENLESVKNRIEIAAKRVGRDPKSVKLIVVTKEADRGQIKEALEAGVSEIGENRVNEAISKMKILDSHVLNWHMIGHLQSNKAGQAVEVFSVIHSVDSLKLARIIDGQAKKLEKVQDILIEVNVSGEESKFGIKPGALKDFLSEALHLRHVNIAGLMTMAPLSNNKETARPCFRKLSELAKINNLKELSMGMTQDFETAIEEGATMVRIGSAIFRGEK